MNIAVILFGESREYNIAKKIFFDYQCKNLNIDVYGHSWTSISCEIFHYVNNNHYVKNDLQKKLRNTYNTRNIIVDDFDNEFKRIQQVAKIHPYELHQWRSFEKATRLFKKSNKKYDLVIVTRFDIITNNELPVEIDAFTDVYNFLKKEKGIVCRNRIENMCDLLFIGDQQAIINYAKDFTRNIIENNITNINFKTKWYMQTKLNNIKITTNSLIPGKNKWPFKSPIMVRYKCPHTDIKPIYNYSNYWALMRDLQRKENNRDYIEKYNPSTDYEKIIVDIKNQPGYLSGDFTINY